jgi:hypothetical protein
MLTFNERPPTETASHRLIVASAGSSKSPTSAFVSSREASAQIFSRTASVSSWPALSWSAKCGESLHAAALDSTYLIILISDQPTLTINLHTSSSEAWRVLAALTSLLLCAVSSRSGANALVHSFTFGCPPNVLVPVKGRAALTAKAAIKVRVIEFIWLTFRASVGCQCSPKQLLAGLSDHAERVARRAAIRIVVDDRVHGRPQQQAEDCFGSAEGAQQADCFSCATRALFSPVPSP